MGSELVLGQSETANTWPETVAIWPCAHGDVLVEPGKAKPGYRCHECGATAQTYVSVEVLLGARTADKVLDELVVAAGGKRGFTSKAMNLARWDLQAALRKVLGL